MWKELDVLVTCPVAVIKYPDKNKLRGEACILALSSRYVFIIMEESQHQEPEQLVTLHVWSRRE